MIATGNVGIGSNTPNAPLDVAGQIRTATTATNCIVAMTSGNGSFGSIESFNLGNTSKLPIALNAYGGNIGIGKTNPSQILDVAGAINCTSFLVNGTAVATGSGSVWGVNGSTAYYTSGSVGIGTITPSQRLHVFGDGARIMAESNTGSNAVVQMKTNANTSYLFTDQNGTLQMYADTGKNVAFMNSNNVGIGITNPSVPLHVNGMTYVQGPTVSTTTTNIVGNFGLRISQLTSTQLVVGQIVGQMCFHGWTRPYASAFIRCITDSTNGYDDAGALVFGTSNGGLGASETVRISENGFVGIGTATPSHRLQVAGAINCTSFLVNGVAVATGTGSVWGVNGSSAYYTSGFVGVGTASPVYPLHVYALQSTSWPFLINYSSGIQIVMGNGGSSTNFMMDTYNSTTGGRPALCLNTSGGFVGIGTTAPAYPTTISNSGFINLEINRTAAGTNYGSGIVHSLTSSTGTFRGDYAYAFGGATTIATSAQSQAFGYYAIDLANAGVFGVNAGGLTSSYFFMTTSSACFPKTNVGIGTASPASKLHVYSTTANDGIMFRNAFNSSTGSIALYTTSAAGNFIINGTADAGVVLPADGKDLFLGRTTSLYTSMVVKGGTGYVGIGVASPSYALDVAGFARATSGLLAGNGTGAVSLQLLDLPTASWQITTGGYNLSINNNSSSWTNRFTISETGNVGIGVAAPSTKLHIYDSSGTNIIRMQTSSVDNAYIASTYDYIFISANYNIAGGRENTGRGSSQIVMYSYANSGGLITFNTSPSMDTFVQERMRIASNGNVGIGTATPGFKLDVAGAVQINTSVATGLTCNSSAGEFIVNCSGTGPFSIDPNHTTNSYVRVWDQLTVTGNFSVSGTKSFSIPHPYPPKRDQGYYLYHSCLETPNAGDTIERFQVSITNDSLHHVITMPDYYYYMCNNIMVLIQSVDTFGRSKYRLERDDTTRIVEVHVDVSEAGMYNIVIIGTRCDKEAQRGNFQLEKIHENGVHEIIDRSIKKERECLYCSDCCPDEHSTL
jgi:hypothetical protein